MSGMTEIVFSAKDLDKLEMLIDEMELEVDPIWDLDPESLAQTGIAIKSIASADWEAQSDLPQEAAEKIKKAV